MTEILDDVTYYADRQRATYETHATSRQAAEALVGPGYDEIRVQAHFQAQFIMNEFLRRRPFSEQVDFDIDILDFGCGVGRVMEAMVELGFTNIDGVDISEKMISYAKQSPLLEKSRFWLTSGNDCGGAPENSYDFVYSLITMHHICLRQTRIDIFRAMQRCLRPGGVVVLEFMGYPGVTSHRVPHNHALWSMNMTAEETNSRADVWITPDQMGLVYEDMRLYFRDIGFQDIDLHTNYFVYSPGEIYQYPNTRFLVMGTKGAGMNQKYFAGA